MIRETKLEHSIKMIKRNKKSYFRLFFSVYLTFAFLIGLFFFTDNVAFNKNKSILKAPSYLSIITTSPSLEKNNNSFLLQVKNIKNTVVQKESVSSPILNPLNGFNIIIHAIPRNFGKLSNIDFEFLEFNKKVDKLNDAKSIIISETNYKVLKKLGRIDKDDNLNIYIKDKNNFENLQKFNVVARITQGNVSEGSLAVGSNSIDGNLDIYMSNENFQQSFLSSFQTEYYYIYSPFAKNITELAYKYNLTADSPSLYKSQARNEMKESIQIKRIIISLAFILLSVNLIGSFSNALNQRRYEIGLKRALGARPFQICIQFMIESLIIMCSALVIAFYTVFNLIMLYKLYLKIYKSSLFIVNLTNASIITLILMCLSMMIISTMFFAYNALSMKIIPSLQGENS